jgi:hypothetical protein
VRRIKWLCASVTVFWSGALVGCSAPKSYVAPATFTVSNQSVTVAIEEVLALNSMVRIDGKPNVDCAGEIRCKIAYTIQQSAGGSSNFEDNELIRPTRQIWKTLFADPKFQSGTITVSGPQTSNGTATQPYYRLSCDRQRTAHTDWSDIDGWGLRQRCEYSPLVGGMPGT